MISKRTFDVSRNDERMTENIEAFGRICAVDVDGSAGEDEGRDGVMVAHTTLTPGEANAVQRLMCAYSCPLFKASERRRVRKGTRKLIFPNLIRAFGCFESEKTRVFYRKYLVEMDASGESKVNY